MVVAHPFAQVAEPDRPGAGWDTMELIVALAVGHGDVLRAHHRYQYPYVADGLTGLGRVLDNTFQTAGSRGIRVHRCLVELSDLRRRHGEGAGITEHLVSRPGEHQLVAASHRDLGDGVVSIGVGGRDIARSLDHSQRSRQVSV